MASDEGDGGAEAALDAGLSSAARFCGGVMGGTGLPVSSGYVAAFCTLREREKASERQRANEQVVEGGGGGGGRVRGPVAGELLTAAPS